MSDPNEDLYRDRYFRAGVLAGLRRARELAIRVARAPMNDEWCSGANQVITRLDAELEGDPPLDPPSFLHDNEGDVPT